MYFNQWFIVTDLGEVLMIDALMQFFDFLLQLYKGLPESVKEEIKEAAVNSMENFFRSFFQASHK